MADFELIALDTTTPELQAIAAGDRGVVPGSLLVEETLEVPNGIILVRIAGSTFFTVQDMQNQFHSAGSVTGGVINDAGGGSVTVDVGTGFIRATDSPVAQLLFFDWSALASTAIPTDTTRFIGVEFNAGSPQVVIRTSENWDLNTDFPLGVVVNEGDVLHIDLLAHQVGDHANGMINRLHEVMGTQRDNRLGGLLLGETGTRNVTMSSGAIWQKLVRTAMSAIDTSGAGTFDIYHRDGAGGFTRIAAETQWPNTEYDNDQAAPTVLGNNKFAVIWFWLENDNDLIAMYGQAEHSTISSAETEPIPALTPDRIKETSILIGQIIFQKNGDPAEEILSAFDVAFSGGSALENHTHTVSEITDLDADLSTFSLPANTEISDFGAVLIDDADPGEAQQTLELVIGTDVLAPDGDGSGLSGVGGAFATSGTENLFAGTNAGNSLTTGTNNFFAGLNAGTGITVGDFNIAIGSGAMDAATTGVNVNNNIAIGGNSMGSGVLTGADNIAIGQLAGDALTSGNTNVLIGLNAGDEMTTGSSNIFLGNVVLNGVVTGGQNIVIGNGLTGDDLTSGSSNIILGASSGTKITTGIDNVIIGKFILNENGTNPTNVIAIGSEAMTSGATTGANNIGIGSKSGNVLTSGADNIYIGRSAGLVNTTGSNQIMIGETLSASGTAIADEYVIGHDITGAGTETTKIGSATDSIVNDWGENATWTHSSDIRMKDIIGSSPLGLDFINNLNPVEFTKKPASQLPEEWGVDKDAKIDTDKIYQGMVAQEVRKALDAAGVGNFGGWREDADGRQRIGDAAFVFPLINAVNELTKQLNDLKEQVKTLRSV